MTKNVLVLGGNGFIGRYTVSALRKAGAQVTIGSRNGSATTREIRLQENLQPEHWEPLIEHFDCIVNCVGILRQRTGETYEAIHHVAPAALASACARAHKRLVHVSALGLSPNAKSRFLTSKYSGEQAIQGAGGDWVIARLSLLDGEGGYGASWLRGVAKLPVFVTPTSARGLIAALTVEDAGEALARLAMHTGEELRFGESRVFELGGDQPLRFADYIRSLRKRHSATQAMEIPVPGGVARLASHLCDLLHFSPFSFGHWELLCRDNVPAPNRLGEVLGRSPSAIT